LKVGLENPSRAADRIVLHRIIHMVGQLEDPLLAEEILDTA